MSVQDERGHRPRRIAAQNAEEILKVLAEDESIQALSHNITPQHLLTSNRSTGGECVEFNFIVPL